MRYFKLKEKEDIIFVDKFTRNIRYNSNYKEGLNFSGNLYEKINTVINARNFYEKKGKKIYHINLTNIKYAGGQEIEATENIIKIYNIEDFMEITEKDAIEILKENELSFSELFDKQLK